MSILSAEELRAIEKRRLASVNMIHALCLPRGVEYSREWMMSIPARPEYDPDLLLAATCTDVSRLLVAVERYLLPLYRMAKQAYGADAIAEWFDEEGDGLKAAIEAYEKWASGEGE